MRGRPGARGSVGDMGAVERRGNGPRGADECGGWGASGPERVSQPCRRGDTLCFSAEITDAEMPGERAREAWHSNCLRVYPIDAIRYPARHAPARAILMDNQPNVGIPN